MARHSATVVLVREESGGGSPDVYLVERAANVQAWGGYHAFPGGCVDASDGDLPIRGVDGDSAAAACALRELFEETGLLLVVSAGGDPNPEPAPEELWRLRHELLETDGEEATRAFADALSRSGWCLDGSRLEAAGRRVTPRFSRRRFDTEFFCVREPSMEPEIVPGELAAGAWWKPAEALDAWRRGELRLVSPTIEALLLLAEHPLGEVLHALREQPADYEDSARVVHVQPGYDLVPLETPPLPRDMPTNSLFVGAKSFYIVDPGPRREAERAHLRAAIDGRIALGDAPEAILLTHHHPDHVGALDDVAQRYQLPVWGHARAGERLERRFDRVLDDGDRVALGTSPDGADGWELEVVFTPGHADSHIAFYDRRQRALVGGDLLSPLVSMYVGSPGGNLHDYFESLERIGALDVETFYPGHGGPLHALDELIDSTVRHRHERIEQVRRLLSDGPVHTLELAERIYPGVVPKAFSKQLVERATRASLEYLVREGRAEALGEDRWRSR